MSEVVELARPSSDERSALDAAKDLDALGEVVKSNPLSLEGWARLADVAYEQGDDVSSYAYARVGYHRGLDQLRGAGWRPGSEVRFEREGNRGFLFALRALMRAAAAIGEGVEARRCREFLLQLDPSDPFEVGGLAPKDLSRRLG